MILSVVIPVYNTIEYLPECLKSIENQHYQDMEIILVDDGSTDGCSDYCDEYQSKHDNVRVIHKENGGASDTRNTGLLAAKGEYIHFIDSDDILLGDSVYESFVNNVYPHKPELILARFEEYSPDFCKLIETQVEYNNEGLYIGDVLREVLINHYPATLTSPVNKIFSREFLISNNLFFTKGIDHEEDEWLPRVLACATRTWISNDVIYGVRKGRAGSLSETLNESVMTRKARSKITIASTGISFMLQRDLSSDTLSLITEYYWDYLIDACVVCDRVRSENLRLQIIDDLKKNKTVFDSYKLLYSKNRLLLGLLFSTLGVRITVKLIGMRYGE